MCSGSIVAAEACEDDAGADRRLTGQNGLDCPLSPILSLAPYAFSEAIQCGGQRVGNQLVLNVISKAMKEGITECNGAPFALTCLGLEVNAESTTDQLPWCTESIS